MVTWMERRSGRVESKGYLVNALYSSPFPLSLFFSFEEWKKLLKPFVFLNGECRDDDGG